jgi:ligand-binding sensor domain-containing protein/signal transduction histidine kinase
MKPRLAWSSRLFPRRGAPDAYPGLLLLFVISFAPSALALDAGRALTQYNHRIWQVPQGLPQASVYAITQTHDGFLWLGTQTGLVRFDGVRFNTIATIGTVSLDKIWVRALLEDREHDLWAATDGQGLFRISGDTAIHFTTADGLPSDVVHSLKIDNQGTVWAATDHGLAKFTGDKWVTVGSPSTLTCSDIRTITADADGKIWIAGPDTTQIFSYVDATFTHVPLPSAQPFTSVLVMLPGRAGQLWVGTSQGLFTVGGGKYRHLTAQNGLADDWVYCLSNSADGSLWVGTKNGFSRVREDSIENYRAKDGLSQSAVFSLTEDREGSLWVGTKHGLNQFLDRRAIPFTESEGLASNNTGAVFQDHNGILWIGTQDSGLCKFDGQRFNAWPHITVKDGLPSNRIASLAETGSENSLSPSMPGNLWAGTDHGLCRLVEGHPVQTMTTADGLPSNDISCLFAGNDGLLWVGTSTGIATIRDHQLIHLAGLGPIENSRILAIGQSHRAIVIASPDGLFRYADSKIANIIQVPNAHWTRDVDCIFEDHDGLLWIGTRGGGLRLIDGDRTFSFSIRDGLYDDDIYGVAVDAHDRLWMACSQGVFWVKRADLRQFAAGKLSALTSNPFSPTDNLRTVESQAGVQPVVCVARDGKLWFSTAHGLIVFDPEHLQRSNNIPPPVVEDVIVNGQRQDPSQLPELAPGQHNLEFHFTGLSFSSPTFMKFRYELEGFDKDWIDAGTRREAFYTNLAPGKYRFKVLASNPDSGFGDLPATVQFTLLPRLYQHAWFFPAVAITALAAAFATYRRRMMRIREHVASILAERSRIARELHDTLLQGFSGVTMEMQALLMRLRGDDDRSVLEGIIQDAAACMREARRSVAGLRSARGEEGLIAAISQSATQLTEATQIRLRLKLSASVPPLTPETEYNILRVAHEAVANAVKHAAASWIEVLMSTSARELRLSIRDDGHGFDPSVPAPGQHYGLIGIRERADQINAAVDVSSRPGRGTTVTLLVPLQDNKSSRAAVSKDEVQLTK